jgi:hypothetical protein
MADFINSLQILQSRKGLLFYGKEKRKLLLAMSQLPDKYSDIFIDEDEALFYLKKMKMSFNKASYIFICFNILCLFNKIHNIINLAKKANCSIESFFMCDVRLQIQLDNKLFFNEISPSLKIYYYLENLNIPDNFISCIKDVLISIENYYFNNTKIKGNNFILINVYINKVLKFLTKKNRKIIKQELKKLSWYKKNEKEDICIFTLPIHYYILKHDINSDKSFVKNKNTVKNVVIEYDLLNSFKMYDENIHDFCQTINILAKYYLCFETSNKKLNCKCWECQNTENIDKILHKVLTKIFLSEEEKNIIIPSIIHKYLENVYHGPIVVKQTKKGLLAAIFYYFCFQCEADYFSLKRYTFSPINICILFDVNMTDLFLGEVILNEKKYKNIINVSPSILCDYALFKCAFPRNIVNTVKPILYVCEKYHFSTHFSNTLLFRYTEEIVDDMCWMGLLKPSFNWKSKFATLHHYLNIKRDDLLCDVQFLMSVISYYCAKNRSIKM